MARLFIDLTDVAHHAHWNSTVTGIQRVQLQVALALVARLRAHAISAYRGQYCDLTELVAAHAQRPIEELFKALRRRFGSPWSRNLPVHGPRERILHLLQAVHRLRRFAGVSRSVPLGSRFELHDIIYVGGAFWADRRNVAMFEQAAARGAKLVAFIHDVIPLSSPQFTDGGARPFFERLFVLPLDLIANSEFTRADIQRARAHINGARISEIDVVKLAHEFSGAPRNGGPGTPSRRLVRLLDGQPFVLSVGTVEIRKNHLWLINAWQQLPAATGRIPKLVIAGRRGWMADEAIRRLTTAKADSPFVFVDTPTDAELRWLYTSALFTVFASLAEGWGLPVGESLWFGTPCIVTNIAAIPEVGGDLCIYVEPGDTEALCKAVLDLWEDPSARQRWREKIADAPLRTWEQVCDDIVAAVERFRAPPPRPK